MYLIVTASLVFVPFLLGGTARAAPVGEVGEVATTGESIQEECAVCGNDITKRRAHDRPYASELPPEHPPVLHVSPPHYEPPRFDRHEEHEKRSAENESNVSLEPRKRWAQWGGSNPNGCCGCKKPWNSWNRGPGCCGRPRW
jgi:hypothetical protein